MTGPTIGPIFFHQSLMASIIGQIPFTLLHLLGNIIFAILLSPAIDKILIKKKSEQQEKSIINKLHPRLI
jgi:Cu/Ag efflux pump CusA